MNTRLLCKCLLLLGISKWNSVNWQFISLLVNFIDTDELSRKAYKGILIEAERFRHDLTLHFGLFENRYKNEADSVG